MELTPLFKALEASGPATTIRDSLLLFPLIESFHVIALALVFGTITIIDLRLLGIASTRRPYNRMAADLMKWTWAAFALAAATGGLMFITNAQVYAGNTFFKVKLGLLALAGLNMILFQFTVGRSHLHWGDGPSAPPLGKVAAALSIALWVSIILMGRLIGFTTTGAAAKEPPPADVNFDDFLGGGAPSDPPPPPAPGK